MQRRCPYISPGGITPNQNRGKGSIVEMFEKPKGEKYHTRTIEVNTYEYDEGRLAVEGCLTDRRWREFHLATGEKKPPGILHQMIIRLLVGKTTLEIEDLELEMPAVPRSECLEAIDSLNAVRGSRIAAGFTAKVKAMAGNGRGCSHLAALLTAMGPSAIQGYASYKLQKSPQFISSMLNMLLNTCWTWRADGPLIRFLKKKIDAGETGKPAPAGNAKGDPDN